MVDAFREDSLGPQIDLDRDLIAHLGQRTTVVTDYREPILGHGERFLLAVEVTDPLPVASAVYRLYAEETGFQEITESGVKVWTWAGSQTGGGGKQAYCVAHGYLIVSDLDLLIETLRRME